ncbi:hypothetical protein EJ06DRAFT_520279 [Trichodelitschia bisporula]|uniref:Uncharacterized protein n=1 Tax=Trichodelitschia bisporula TaxID=703511 RepID=A0A6G1I1V2_9PEZI|nr:hypothetical protein EJ06DRAFT_520279 [Trichodelitschia bisporula]
MAVACTACFLLGARIFCPIRPSRKLFNMTEEESGEDGGPLMFNHWPAERKLSPRLPAIERNIKINGAAAMANGYGSGSTFQCNVRSANAVALSTLHAAMEPHLPWPGHI